MGGTELDLMLGLEEEDNMLLDPPDPVDLLIAHTDDRDVHRPRPLDFVRAKMQDLKKENKTLKERVTDLEQTLSIVQTAQEWTMGTGMSAEQAEKMREIKALLEQAKRARAEIKNFSEASRTSLYEKLRQCKNTLQRERDQKREMKERLVQAFHHARVIQDQHRRVIQQREEENEAWQSKLREMKERHRRELRRMQGDTAAMESDRHDQLSHFGEQVMNELSSLQQHLKEVREETVDTVVADGDGMAPYGSGYGGAGGGGGGDGEYQECKLLFFNPLDEHVLFSVGGSAEEDEEGETMVHGDASFSLKPKAFKTFTAVMGDLVLGSTGGHTQDEFVCSGALDSMSFANGMVQVASLPADGSAMANVAQSLGRSLADMEKAAKDAPVPPETRKH